MHPKLARDIINGVRYQRYERRREKQKGRRNVNVWAAEEIMKEEQ